MSDTTLKASEASGPRAVLTDQASSDPVVEGPTDSSFGEHNLSFTTTDLSLVEMTEIEYTQLQHILYSHMEAQSNENEVESRLNLNCFSTNNAANQSHYLSSSSSSQGGFSSNSSGNQSLYPIICQSGLTSDSSFTGPNQCLGHIDFQELRMMLLSESSLPPGQVEKAPNGNPIDINGQNLVKLKYSETSGSINKENVVAETLAAVPESRTKSAVRVRLEDRFNSLQTEIPRCQETQETGVALNNLVTLIRHPSEAIGVPLHQQQNKCTALVKNRTAATATTALQFTCPVFTPNAASPATGSTSAAQAQSSGASVVETVKHQDLALPRAFSVCYQQEIETSKQTVGARNKAVPEHVWIKLGEEAAVVSIPWIPTYSAGLSVTFRMCVRIKMQLQLRVHGRRSSQPKIHTTEAKAASPNAGRGTTGWKETEDTDKATTLQWTTAFLKYIQERHGDSLKKEFETVFCGKTGRRLKLTRSDPIATCAAQEITQNSTSTDMK
ncbi:hypothetical protein E2320_009535 [Naja naja]|nr:hypothetical protein E2320_009535 [Naja naja]